MACDSTGQFNLLQLPATSLVHFSSRLIPFSMPRKCSCGGCKTGYLTSQLEEKVPCYSFPVDPEERKLWCVSLPNQIHPEKVTKYMSLCAKHWPNDTPMKKVKGRFRPAVLPSIFPGVLDTLWPQMTPTTLRKVQERGISFEKHNLQDDQLNKFLLKDKIPKRFEDFINALPQHISKLFSTCPYDEGICIYMLNFSVTPPVVEVAMYVTQSFAVSVYHRHTVVQCKDILGFQCRLSRWSQLEEILH